MKSIALSFIFLFAHSSLAINSQSYFKDTIQDYKKDIAAKAAHLKKENPKIEYGGEIIPAPLPTSMEYTPIINYLLIPSAQKQKLVVLQSGVHGIEGLAGAGVQNFVIDYLKDKKFKTISFLYLHMVNPWGSHNFRRTNKANVDLNRNFVFNENDFKQNNDDYGKIQSFLNPDTPYEHGLFKKLTYFFDAFSLINKYSIDTLRRSILKGQYTYPKGLYFGGQEYQPEMKALKTLWDKQIQGYQKVVYIDLHTGYGEKGKLHLLAGHSETQEAKKLSDFFAPTPIDFGDAKNFYQTTGDVLSYFNNYFKDKTQVIPIAYEYGTLNSQSTFGSLESLYRMLSENQAFQNAEKTSAESKKHIDKLFKDMFYPPEFEWRDKVLVQTKTEIDKVIERLGD